MESTTVPKKLSYKQFALIVIGYLVIIQGIGLFITHALNVEATFATTKGVILNMWVPLGLALIYTYAIIALLNWKQPVMTEHKRVRKWVWIVPVILILSILAAIDYGALGDKTIGYVLALLLATQIVGWGEEGMFRGIGVQTLRLHGLSEGKVALWSSLIFGSVHLTNAISHGAQAIPQALAVSFAGYFFYLTRRVSGGNTLNSILHGVFDFSLLTGTVILMNQKAYIGSLAGILAYVLIAVILIIRRKKIELA
jgi:uncharacterized protein